MGSRNDVSIIICCYNSERRLPETLLHIFRLQIPLEINVELLVVDNNCTDYTVAIAQDMFIQHGIPEIPARIITESRAGLLYARQAGVRESKYDLIMFCDDDNHLQSDYVVKAIDAIRNDSGIGIVGGWPKPKIPYYPGKWIEANFPALGIESVPKEKGYKDWVFGAGMIVNKQIFKDLEDRGIKLLLSGRQGNKQTSGDDAEICRLARMLGYKIYYDPALTLGHAVSPHRLTKLSFIKANYRNVFMVLYFRVLESLITTRQLSLNRIYFSFLRESLVRVFYFLPRLFFGKNKFFSFIIFYQNVQVILSLLFSRHTFVSIYYTTKENLYGNGAFKK